MVHRRHRRRGRCRHGVRVGRHVHDRRIGHRYLERGR
jgi:hypothetical protein